MTAPRIRILSDLHFGDPRSSLRDLGSLAPLLTSADEIILNGDTLDTVAPATLANQNTVRSFFSETGARVTYLSGNHDPDISPLSELSLAGGRIWVTHGDVLFDHIAPWSHHAPELIRRLREASAAVPAGESARLETRLRLNRLACTGLMASATPFPAHPAARLRRLLRTLFPPRRLIAILRAWRDTPQLARSLAKIHRPEARVVIIGHTHRPGVWRETGKNGITVINTGSFSRPLGGALVELTGERLRVLRIVRRGADFHPGPLLADLDLPAS